MAKPCQSALAETLRENERQKKREREGMKKRQERKRKV